MKNPIRFRVAAPNSYVTAFVFDIGNISNKYAEQIIPQGPARCGQVAVNDHVVGSNPTWGAKLKTSHTRQLEPKCQVLSLIEVRSFVERADTS